MTNLFHWVGRQKFDNNSVLIFQDIIKHMNLNSKFHATVNKIIPINSDNVTIFTVR